MKTHLTPIGALLIYVILLATYSFCIWQTAIVVHPIQQEVEISDWQNRCEKCHEQLLKVTKELEKQNKYD